MCSSDLRLGTGAPGVGLGGRRDRGRLRGLHARTLGPGVKGPSPGPDRSAPAAAGPKVVLPQGGRLEILPTVGDLWRLQE